MSILGFLFLVFGIYLAYRFLFGFVLPVYRTTRKLRRGFREMQEKMQEQTRQQQQPSRPNVSSPSRPADGDYIDFEEVK